MIFDFNKDASINSWFMTNDNVMGGVSTSQIKLDDNGNGVFFGSVSTENNGGFVMTRLLTDVKINPKFTKIVLRVKGDGKQYQLRLKSERKQRFWYVQKFQTTNKWQTVELKLTEFYPSFRGYQLDRPNFSSEDIKEVAILIGNKKDENFKLEIDYIKVV